MNLLFGNRRSRPALERELEEFRATARECGCEAGLHGLPGDGFARLAEARIRCLARDHWPPPAVDPDVIARQIATLEQRLMQAGRPAEDDAGSSTLHPARRTPSTLVPVLLVSVGTLIAGLLFERLHGSLGTRGWMLIVASGGLLALVVATLGPGLRVLDRGARGCAARWEAWRLRRRIRKLERKQTDALNHEKWVERWIGEQAMLASETHELHRRRGERARMLVDLAETEAHVDLGRRASRFSDAAPAAAPGAAAAGNTHDLDGVARSESTVVIPGRD